MKMTNDVQILNLKSGDVLVLKTEQTLDPTKIEDMSDRLKEKVKTFGFDIKVLVLTAGLQPSILRFEHESSSPPLKMIVSS